MEIEARNKNVQRLEKEKVNLISNVEKSKNKISEISRFLSKFDIDTYEEKQKRIDENKEKIEKFIEELEAVSTEKTKLQSRSDLLQEVPCGDSFPECKFIKDAHEATGLIQIKSDLMGDIAKSLNSLGASLNELDPDLVKDRLDKYQSLFDMKEKAEKTITDGEISIDKKESALFKERTILEKLNVKLKEYEDNRDAIENFEGLLSEKKSLQSEERKLIKECESCKSEQTLCLERLVLLNNKSKTLKSVKRNCIL